LARPFSAPLGNERSQLLWIARRYSRFVPLIGFLGLVAGLLEGVGITLLIPLVAILLARGSLGGLPRPIAQLVELVEHLSPEMRILALGGAMMALIVLKGLVQAANNALIANVDGRLGRDIRDSLCQRVLGLDYSFFLSNESSRLAQIISTDCWYASEAVRAILSTIPAALAIAVIAVFLVWLDWRLSLIVLAGAFVVQSGIVLFQRKQRQLGFDVVASNHALGERMLTVVSAIRSIRVFGQQRRELERFASASDRVRTDLFRTQRVTVCIVPLVEVLVSIMFLVVLLAAYRLSVSIPAVTAYLVLLARVQPHAQTISRASAEIASLAGSISEVEWLLRQHPTTRSLAGSHRVPAIDLPIRFESVSYAYPDGTAALDEVSAVIRPGRATALVGKSGAGKTSFVDLLCRLAEPASGAIYHGDQPIVSLDPHSWRLRIAIAGQNVDLVEGTIAENIAYGRTEASQEEIEEAAIAANASTFIGQLPKGYQTRLGFDGLKLSGGQRQRIGLARALLRRPDLLILDEATSAVDAFSERRLGALLKERRWFRTALVISHRKSTLAACEEGIVLDHGRVLESGPLESLSYFHQMAQVSDG
jgi:subfamily B ATP-binding cassette protein MsbA